MNLPDECLRNSPLGIQRREGIEKIGSWRTIENRTFTLLFGKSKDDRNCLDKVCDPPCRGYWDLHSMWHDNSELSILGDESGKCPHYTEFQSYCNFRKEVCSKAKNPLLALKWTKEIAAAKSLDDLITPTSRTANISLIVKNRIWWWRQHWQGATTSKYTSERRSVSESRELKRSTDFSEGDKLLFWSTKIFDLMDPTIKFKDYRGCSVSNWRTTTFRTLIHVGSMHCCWQVILHRQSFKRFVRHQVARILPSSDNHGSEKSRHSARRRKTR